MSNFMRDLAIAKFPRFGIDYYIQLVNEPEIYGSSIKATLQFYDGKTTPPTALSQRTIKLPLWKWGDYVDVIEAEVFSEDRHIVAVQLEKRRAEDEYGTLRIQHDKQVTLDALITTPPPQESGPPKPSLELHTPTDPDVVETSPVPGGRGQPGAGAQPEPMQAVQSGGYTTAGPVQQDTVAPAAPCTHPFLDLRLMIDAEANMKVWGNEYSTYECTLCKELVNINDCGERVG